MYCPEKVVLQYDHNIIDTGLIIQPPDGYYFTVHVRSGISIKNNISLTNDVGIIDPDYCGEEDTLKISLSSNSGLSPIVNKGDRIAQLIFHKDDLPNYEICEQFVADFARKDSRGGLGSTGK